MSSIVDSELVGIYEREVEGLALATSKYSSILGSSEIDAIVRTFRLAIEHSGDKVTAQMLFDIINDDSKVMNDLKGDERQ